MAKQSMFGIDLIQAMSEALSHASGAKMDGTITHVVDIAAVDAKAMRLHLNLTQGEMALLLGTSLSGYRNGNRVSASRAVLPARFSR